MSFIFVTADLTRQIYSQKINTKFLSRIIKDCSRLTSLDYKYTPETTSACITSTAMLILF